MVKKLPLWMEFLDERTQAHCALCGNYGIIDTRGSNLKTPAGLRVSVRTYCICPNGRKMKKVKAKL